MENFENWKWFYLQVDRNSVALSTGPFNSNSPLITGAYHMVRIENRLISTQHQCAAVDTKGSHIFTPEKKGKYMESQNPMLKASEEYQLLESYLQITF